MSKQTVLSKFDGREVLQSTIKITRAGDGLSAALSVDLQEYHIGDRVYVALECEVGKVTFEPVKDTDVFRRVHTFVTENATIVDSAAVASAIAETKKKIQEAKGIEELPFEGDDDSEEAEE